MLRASEYVSGDQSGHTSNKGLQGVDVTPKSQGESVRTLREANEVVIKIRASKTDQFNRGEWRNHFKVEIQGEAEENSRGLRVVEALALY